ncbi:MAG: hypothetical protein ACRCX2_10370 [Paraclostridium sp.]
MSTLSNITTQLDSVKTDIASCHSKLKTNLSAKGVSVLPTDKLSDLINKIPSIATGKRWATGSLNSTSFSSNGSTSLPHSGSVSIVIADVTGLDFRPRLVFCYCQDFQQTDSTKYFFISGDLEPSKVGFQYFGTGSTGSSWDGVGYRATHSEINNNGFSIYLPKNPGAFGVYYNWYAFE